jgi:hypothetical protein
MARRCRVCESPDREVIDARLLTRPNYLALQREYGISEDSFRRHTKDHIPGLLVKSIEARGTGTAERLVAIVNRSLEDLNWAADRGKAKGDTRAVIMAAGKRVSVFEALVRVCELQAEHRIDPPTPQPRATVTDVASIIEAELAKARAEVTVRVEAEVTSERSGQDKRSGVRPAGVEPLPAKSPAADLWPEAV